MVRLFMKSSVDSFTVSVVQCALAGSIEHNLATLSVHVKEAASKGADVVVLPELFGGPYFCNRQDERHFALAFTASDNPLIKQCTELAKIYRVVLPVSYFEQDGPHYYNSITMVDADGAVLGTYRKSHIPDGPGYQEKFYFRPGNTGFRVWKTKFGTVGVGICWDQWFPECARAMTLMGAEVLLYPTAIGSEPHDPELQTAEPWQRAMVGHAVCNAIPVAAANRIGQEQDQRFYGRSFVCNPRGDMVCELGEGEEGVGVARFDRSELQRYRAAFGFFRDRRPELYTRLAEPP